MSQSSENPYHAPSVLESPETPEPLPWKQPSLADFLQRGVLVALVAAPFWFVYMHFWIEQDLISGPGTTKRLASAVWFLCQFCLQCGSKAWLMGLCSSLVPHRKSALHFVAVGVGVSVAENIVAQVATIVVPFNIFVFVSFAINLLFPALLLTTSFVWLASRRISMRALGIIAVTSVVVPPTLNAILNTMVSLRASSPAMEVTVSVSLGVVNLAFMLWIACRESRPLKSVEEADSQPTPRHAE